MLISAPAFNASIKLLVPDFAIVPRLLIISSFVMPIPVSIIDNVLLSLFGSIFMSKCSAKSVELIKDSYLFLSNASEELEINSLRNISLFE